MDGQTNWGVESRDPLCPLGWLKIWSYLNLVSLAGEMIPFPSQMITLKSGGNQMKFTHGRNPPSFPIENVQEGFWPLQLPIFYNGNGVGLRPWVNFVWSSPDFRVTIYDGNGHISPARKTRFGFDHILSHPTVYTMYQCHPFETYTVTPCWNRTKMDLNPAMRDRKS